MNVKNILLKPVHVVYWLVVVFIQEHPTLLLTIFYKNHFWKLRQACLKKRTKLRETLYYAVLQKYGAWIGLGATFDAIPTLPHSFNGIFISHNARIGKNVTIFHQVTIGSNMTVGSKNQGAPTIGDNVYIGCGAKIIGNCKIGNNVRIGANCIVVKDVPDNCICVMRNMEMIQREEVMDNTWVRVDG